MGYSLLHVYLLTLYYFRLMPSVNSERDVELTIDTSNWIDPNDPFQLQYLDNHHHCKCDCASEIEEAKKKIGYFEETTEKLQKRLSTQPEDFAKRLLNELFFTMNIDPAKDDGVYKSVHVTLTKDNLQTIESFLNEPEPTQGLKSQLHLALADFLRDVGDEREHWALVIFRNWVPYLAGINVVVLMFVFFYYGIFKSRKLMLLMIFSGFFVNEIVRTVNKKHKEAMARVLAAGAKRNGDAACEPKSYFMAAADYVISTIARTEDECYNVYRDSLVETELDVSILGSAAVVVGETIGSIFEGLVGPIGRAVEMYFAKGGMIIIGLKVLILVIIALVFLAFMLKVAKFEIQIPFAKLHWSVGQGIEHHQHNYQNIQQPPVVQHTIFQSQRPTITPTYSAPFLSGTRRPQMLRSRSSSSSIGRLPRFQDAIEAHETFEETRDSDSPTLSPNITPRTEARRRNMHGQ